MKKLITGILATLACLGCMTSCNILADTPSFGDSTSQTTQTYNIKEAEDYLKSMYPKTAETDRDYTVTKAFIYDGATYTVTWAVDTTAVKIVVGEKDVTVDVDEAGTEDLTYTLTATITAPDGQTGSVSFSRKVLAAATMVVSPITSAPQEDVAYKFHFYQPASGNNFYLVGEVYKT